MENFGYRIQCYQYSQKGALKTELFSYLLITN